MRSTVAATLLIAAALTTAACHTMKPVSMAELNALKPERAWATEANQTVVVVEGPQVVGDTLVGYVNGVYEEMLATRFKEAMVEKPATQKTALLVGALAVGFGGMVYALTGSGESRGVDPSYCEEHEEDPACMNL